MIHWKLKYAVVLLTLSSLLLLIDVSNPPFSNVSGPLDINEVAGTYILGDTESGLRSILVVRADWNFVWDYGFGRFNGTLMWDGTKLVLETEKEGAITENLVPIKWGPRRYLVPVQSRSFFTDQIESYNEQIAKFCGRIARGEEPRESPYGAVYLLHGDWERDVSGSPLTSWGARLCS